MLTGVIKANVATSSSWVIIQSCRPVYLFRVQEKAYPCDESLSVSERKEEEELVLVSNQREGAR